MAKRITLQSIKNCMLNPFSHSVWFTFFSFSVHQIRHPFRRCRRTTLGSMTLNALSSFHRHRPVDQTRYSTEAAEVSRISAADNGNSETAISDALFGVSSVVCETGLIGFHGLSSNAHHGGYCTSAWYRTHTLRTYQYATI